MIGYNRIGGVVANNQEEVPPTEGERRSWWDWIVTGATDLAEIYKVLVDAGIIKDAKSLEGMTREEIAALVDARLAAAMGWRTYVPWIIAGGLGIGLILVLTLRRK